MQFPLAMVEHLTTVMSDHLLLLLKLDSTVRRKGTIKRFQYEVMWDSHPNLNQAIDSLWNANGYNPTTSKVRAKLSSWPMIWEHGVSARSEVFEVK